ncbi:MAG: glycoside hydrolase family 92 protein, partial [Bacteroidales bacterium]|nr:glycoside hydrolase family 92 protein [Bacteroidales bacterium]
KPFARQGIALDNKLQEGIAKAQGTNIKAFVGFETTKDEVIEVKVALSAVDIDGALKNLNAELPGWGFEDTRKKAFETWNKELSRIIVKGGSEDQKKVYYTALYHTFVQPNTFNDVDGRYRGIDKNIHTTDCFTNYTVFSLWDTYRAWHPLMTILDTARSNDFVKVMLNMYDKGGLLPIWELAANETYCMIGNHAISVIADAYMKGIRNYDAEKALEAMIHSATQNHHGLDVYQKYGHIPGDMEHESISKTLEYAYNDWCIAQVAKAMGKDSIYNVFIQRAQYYKNIFDPSTGFMRPKLNGSWLDPFNPTVIDWHFTEANSWQYSFYVPQDITGLYQLHGGKENMLHKLDELFETTAPVSGRDVKDITGLIGQYVHGNEPSHHAAYLFNFVNQPWKTQQWVRKIMDELYTSKPDGLCGNEDCGQMSAWLVISAMGFYPVAPGSSQYVIGTPWFPEMEINLQNGKVFKITADKVSAKNKYIQSIQLNAADYPYSYIRHEDIMKGGHLHFVMGSQPNTSWGSDDAHIPVTKIDETLILSVPVIIAAEKHIKDSLMVEIASVSKDAELFYTLDGSIPSHESLKYQSPISLTKTTTLNAVAFKEGVGYSFPVKSEFIKIDVNRKVDIKNPYSQSYHGGGPEALIDGIRGAKNWRLGGWQGYQGTDFEATIDLGKVQSISYVAAGFTQDIRSWIWMPKDVTFWISNDNIDFKQIAFIKNPISADDYEMYIKDLSAKVKAKGRYVRIKATNFGTIPQWHLGAGGQAYIFVDEVVIE